MALIVDDEEDLLDLLAGEFHSAGFTVTRAVSGSAAKDLIATNQYHLLVFDYRIEGPDGLDLAELTRRTPQNMDSTIWVMTGAADSEFITRMVEANIDLFIQKPIDLNEMRVCLNDAFPKTAS